VAGTPAGLDRKDNPPEPADRADDATLCVSGRVEPRSKVTIRATLSLPLMEMPYKEGDRVTRGDGTTPASVLARLDDSSLKAALRAVEAKRDAQAAELEAAKVRLTAMESQIASSRVCLGEAERRWERYRQIMHSDSASRTEIDEAHCKFDRAKADHDVATRNHAAGQAGLRVAGKNLKAAEEEVERARLAVETATLESPIDGVITRVNAAVGEVVTGTINNPGTVLMEVADMDEMVLVARVEEELVGKVQAGQKGTVHLKGFDETFTGTVEKVALACTQEQDGSRHFKARISLDRNGRTIPAGLTGEARIDCLTKGTQS
jgi:HlyD family secretion protein